MKNALLFSIMVIILATFLISCEKDTSEFQEIETSNLEIDAKFEYARLLSVAIAANKRLNNSLEELSLKALKKGYYEQEFFVALEGYQQLPEMGNQSLSDILIGLGNEDSEKVLRDLSVTNPGMSVLLIGDEEIRGFTNRVYVDDNFDDSDTSSKVKYFINGELFSHAISELPDRKAFIVRESEAYVSEDRMNSAQFKSLDTPLMSLGQTLEGKDIMVQSFNLFEEELDGDGGGGSGGGGGSHGCNETCERDCPANVNKTENLWRFKTNNDYDSGFRGKGEWYFLIIFADDVQYTLTNGAVNITGNPLGYIKTGQIGSVRGNNEWHTANFSSIFWDRATDGDRMKIIAYEADGGRQTTINASLTFGLAGAPKVFSIPITINNGDDFIGEILIEYCHGLRGVFPYIPAGGVEIQLNQR